MVVKAEQERIKALLKDTVTLLCRNGLAFKKQFSIEAVIGVTVDHDDILLVSINETVKSNLAKDRTDGRQDSQSSDEAIPTSSVEQSLQVASQSHMASDEGLHDSPKRKKMRPAVVTVKTEATDAWSSYEQTTTESDMFSGSEKTSPNVKQTRTKERFNESTNTEQHAGQGGVDPWFSTSFGPPVFPDMATPSVNLQQIKQESPPIQSEQALGLALAARAASQVFSMFDDH